MYTLTSVHSLARSLTHTPFFPPHSCHGNKVLSSARVCLGRKSSLVSTGWIGWLQIKRHDDKNTRCVVPAPAAVLCFLGVFFYEVTNKWTAKRTHPSKHIYTHSVPKAKWYDVMQQGYNETSRVFGWMWTVYMYVPLLQHSSQTFRHSCCNVSAPEDKYATWTARRKAWDGDIYQKFL